MTDDKRRSGRPGDRDRDRRSNDGRGARRPSDRGRDGGRGSSRDGGWDRREDDRSRRPARGVLNVGDSPGAELPRWVRDEISRVTSKERLQPTLNLLQDAAYGFASGKYRQVLPKLQEAKKLSSRTATIRELLGLTHYRLEQWEEALREMRTFRRLSGETTHMAVEMDALRALGRRDDVIKTWGLLRELGGDGHAMSEARVVYGSFLLEEGRAKDAWNVVKPARLANDAPEHVLREWYVAARAAASIGDRATALQIAKAIEKRDISFPGLEELQSEIDN